MSVGRISFRAQLGVVGVLLWAVFHAAPAIAETTATACMPYLKTTGKLATGKPIVAGTEAGTCKNTTSVEYHPLSLPGGAGFELLNKLLAHMTYVEKGVGGKPTIQFSGVNVQIVNGGGETFVTNGAGNLILGYDESPGGQTGSHNLILGWSQKFTSYAGILAGAENTATAPAASVLGGAGNQATGQFSSVTSGESNAASGLASAVGGGEANRAGDFAATVTGGESNLASGQGSSVSGGAENTVSREDTSVSGGTKNQATWVYASVSGGYENTADGLGSWVGGGFENTAQGSLASVFGGNELAALNLYEAIP
jgi:hypothetical protein